MSYKRIKKTTLFFVKWLLANILYFAGFFYIAKYIFSCLTKGNAFVALCYHRVIEDFISQESSKSMKVHPRMFEKQIEYLSKCQSRNKYWLGFSSFQYL